ncbi:hypothetical protein [Desulforhopalus sp. 52FAK]
MAILHHLDSCEECKPAKAFQPLTPSGLLSNLPVNISCFLSGLRAISSGMYRLKRGINGAAKAILTMAMKRQIRVNSMLSANLGAIIAASRSLTK